MRLQEDVLIPCACRVLRCSGLGFELGLGQTDGALAFLPLAALLHELDAFETLEDRTLTANGTSSLECGMLGHNVYCL